MGKAVSFLEPPRLAGGFSPYKKAGANSGLLQQREYVKTDLPALFHILGEYHLARGRGFVQAAHRQPDRRVRQTLRIGLALGDDLMQGVHIRVQGFLALGFRGLGHQAFLDDQREVDGRRMEAPVQQGLGNVQGAGAFGRGGHELMGAEPVGKWARPVRLPGDFLR